MAFTYFFRDVQTLELIVKHVLPVLKGHKYINIWDAGCAHGPEPYSIAIMLRENMTHFLFRNVRIYATDIDGSNQFGPIITDGVYPEGEIKRIPLALRRKHFLAMDDGEHYRIADELRARVSFIQHNLLSLTPIRTGFGLIVCKNVLLHFSERQRADVVRMFHSTLRPGGFLVTEQTQKLPATTGDLYQQVTPEAQIFRKLEPQASVGGERIPANALPGYAQIPASRGEANQQISAELVR